MLRVKDQRSFSFEVGSHLHKSNETPKKHVWKGIRIYQASLNGTHFGGGKLDANLWWCWGISPLMVLCLGWTHLYWPLVTSSDSLLLMFHTSTISHLFFLRKHKQHEQHLLDKVPISTGLVHCRISADTHQISTQFWLCFCCAIVHQLCIHFLWFTSAKQYKVCTNSA